MKPKDVRKQKKRIAIIALVVVVLVAAFLLFKNQIFADVISDSACTTDHPYIIKTGKQAYKVGQTQVLNPSAPGVPENYLIRIDRNDAKVALGNYPDQKTIVCYKKSGALVQIPSYIDTSGEMLFQVQEDIAQNSEVKYYISTTANASNRLNLVQPSDIESHPFANSQTFDPTKTDTYWQKAFKGGGSASFTPVNDLSPGGTDTLLVKDFAQTIHDPSFNTRVYPNPSFLYDPAVDQTKKDTYIIGMGWVKYKNVQVDQDQDSVPLDTRYGAKITSNLYKNGVWAEGAGAGAWLLVNSSLNSEWVRYFYPVPLGDQNLLYSYSFETANISSGEISYSDFKLIKNIKAPRSIANWSTNVVHYFEKPMINPQSSISYPGVSFSADQNTKLYLANNFSDYYKDHFDEDKLVLTNKLQQTLLAKYSATINPSEIKDFKADKSIIIGDLTNSAFRAFAYKLRPDLENMEIKDEGFRLLVGEKYVLIVGKDMRGSYYGALRLTDLIENSDSISQRSEEDYPDSSFRSILSFNISQRTEKRYESDGKDGAGLTAVKSDIKNLSSLRYNIYQLSGPNEYEFNDVHPYMQKFQEDSFAFARKYFMEPLATSFSFSYPYGSVITGTSTQNLVYKEREVSFPSTQSSYQFALNLVRKYSDDLKTTSSAQENINIPFLVKNADKTITYQEGVDYSIEYKMIANDANYKAFFITIPSTSSIQPIPAVPATNPQTSNYKLNMTYNGDNGKSSKSSRLTSKRAREVISTNILNAINALHPKYININDDEVAEIGLDYRDIYNPDGTLTNATPESLFAEAVQFQYDIIKNADPNIKIIMWSDMLNPYHRYGSGNYSVKPYTFSVSKLIPKDIIIDEWYMMAGGSETCQQVTSAMNYHLTMGFKILASPLTTTSPEIYSCVDQIAKANSSQFIGYNIPEWTDTHDDKPSAKLHSDQIWNSDKTQASGSTTSQVWQDEDFIVPSPTPVPSPSKTTTIGPRDVSPTPTSTISSPPNPDEPTTYYTFPKGFSTLGVTKSLSTSLITTVDGLYVYQFDGPNNKWLMAPTDSFTLEPSKGYYVYNKLDTKSISLPYDTFATNSYALTKGWNMLHSTNSKQRSDIRLNHNNTPSTIDSLITQNIINPKVFIIDNDQSKDSCTYFSLLDTTDQSSDCSASSPKKTKSIPSGKAFWVYVR